MTKKRTVSTICLAVLLSALVCAVGVSARPARAEVALSTEVSFESAYAVGETVLLPDAQILHEGQALATEKTVRRPDGTTAAADSVTVDKKGAYTVTYSATVGVDTLSRTFAFDGYYPLYSMQKKASSAYYGASTKYGGIEGRDGVIVRLAPGDTFEWGEIIDLKGKTRTDDLLKMYVTPDKLGTVDANKILFALVDRYDEENYITLTLKKVMPVVPGAAWAETTSYVTAGAFDQLQMGLTDTVTQNPVVYEGVAYGREIGTKMGSAVNGFSLPGTPKYVQNNADSISEELFLQNPQCFTFSFDYENYVFYAGNGSKTAIVADLDAEECFDTPWRGFTTGEVYLRISGQEYVSSSLNFVLTEVDGVPTADTAGIDNRVVDTTAPTLTVELPDDVPQAVSGVPYKLFHASAYDVYDGEIAPTVTVKAGTRPVKVLDGTFTPTIAARHTVTYTATDYSGNSTSQTIEIAVRTGETLTAVLQEETPHDPFVTGRAVRVRDYLTQNASGAVYGTVTATRIADTQGNATDGVSYAVQDGSFVPMYGGKYSITYTIRDHLTALKLSYETEVGINDGVEIVELPTLPRCYIGGMLYKVPEAKAYRFDTEGAHEVPVTVSWAGDASEQYVAAGGGTLFAPVANEKVKLRFAAEYDGKTATKYCEVSAVDVGYNAARLHLENYFAPEEGDVTATAFANRIELSASEAVRVSFVNALQAAEFALRFSMTNVEAATVTLTSATDETRTLSIGYSDAHNGKLAVTIATPAGEISTRINYTDGDTLEPKYIDDTRTVYVTEKSSFDISHLFGGFDSAVWLEISFETNGGALKMYELNGQGLTDVAQDRIRPMILTDVEGGERSVGETYVVRECTVGDVLDPYVNAYFYMTAPDGSFVTANCGTVLDGSADYTKPYEITFSLLGDYTIQYYASDSAQNEATFSFRIRVTDHTAPTIRTDVVDGTVLAGGTIAPPSYTVSDDVTAADKIVTYAYIVMPNGASRAFTESVTATQKGVYRVILHAYDEQGNCAVYTYTVTAGDLVE